MTWDVLRNHVMWNTIERVKKAERLTTNGETILVRPQLMMGESIFLDLELWGHRVITYAIGIRGFEEELLLVISTIPLVGYLVNHGTYIQHMPRITFNESGAGNTTTSRELSSLVLGVCVKRSRFTCFVCF